MGSPSARLGGALCLLGLLVLAPPATALAPGQQAQALVRLVRPPTPVPTAAKVEDNAIANATAGVTAVGKVTTMLQEMRSRSLALQQQADSRHAEVVAACDNASARAETQVDALSLQVGTLEAAIGEAEASLSALAGDVAALKSAMGASNGSAAALAVLRAERATAAEAAARDVEEYNSAIGSVERALDVLKQQQQEQTMEAGSAGGSAFLATGARQRRLRSERRQAAAASAAREAARAAARIRHLSRRYQPDSGGLSKDDSLFDEFDSLDANAGRYTSRSGSIFTLLEDLETSFRSQREQLLEGEKTSRATFELEVQSLQEQLATDGAAHTENSASLASGRARLTEDRQELAETSADLKGTQAFHDELTSACAARATAYEDIRIMRSQEIEALSTAMEIMTHGVATKVASLPPVLLRLATDGWVAREPRAPSDATEEDGERRALGLLRSRGSTLHSESLNRVACMLGAALGAVRISHGAAAALDDPLAKVKEMISSLVTNLQVSATEEASHKAWCDSELSSNAEAQEATQAEVTKDSVKVGRLHGESGKMEMELADLRATLTAGNATRPLVVSQRAAESQEHAATIADAEESASLLNQAMVTLESYISNTASMLLQSGSASTADPLVIPDIITRAPGAEAKSLATESRGVVSILEVARDGYLRLAKETKAQEAAAQAEYEKVLLDHDIMVAAATADEGYKSEELARLKDTLKSTSLDLNASSASLADAEAAHEQLKPPCLNTETYEERKIKRDAEISALEDAVSMLDEYAAQYSAASTASSALLQRGSSRELPGGLVHAVLASVSKADNNNSNAASEADELLKVAQLLGQMRVEVLADLADDTKVNTDMEEWCADTIALKRSAIADATQREQDLLTEIETTAQANAALKADLEHHAEERDGDDRSLDERTSLRERSAAEFRAAEIELVESVSSLKSALAILEKHYADDSSSDRDLAAEREQLEQAKQDLEFNASVTTNGTALWQAQLVVVAAGVTRVLRARPLAEAALDGLSEEAKASLEHFLSQPDAALLSWRRGSRQEAALVAGASRGGAHRDSNAIFGVLQQLLETFKADLAAARSKEESDSADFLALKTSKLAQTEALMASITSKKEQIAHYQTANAEAHEDFAFNSASRVADTAYLRDVQLQCQADSREFAFRNVTRHDELASLAEAIDILTAGEGISLNAAATMLLHHHSASTTGRVFRRRRRAGDEMGSRGASSTNRANASKLAAAAVTTTMGGAAGAAQGHASPLSPSSAAPGASAAVVVAAVAPAPPRPSVGDEAVKSSAEALAAHATRAKLGLLRFQAAPLTQSAIAEVVGHLDELSTTLREEKLLEIKMHDTCIAEENSAKYQLERRLTDADRHNATVKRLDALLVSTSSTIVEIKADLGALNQTLALARAQRDEAHTTFRTTVEEQEAHQAILRQAKTMLESHYSYAVSTLQGAAHGRRERSLRWKYAILLDRDDNITGAPTLAIVEPELPAREASRINKTAYEAQERDQQGFSKPLEKHEAGGGIITILLVLVENSEDLVEALVRAEQGALDAQYVDLNDAERVAEAKDRQVLALEKVHADTEVARLAANTSLAESEEEISELGHFLDIVEINCRGVFVNFTSDQEARANELVNLLHARKTLHGMVTTVASSATLLQADTDTRQATLPILDAALEAAEAARQRGHNRGHTGLWA